MSDVSYRKVVNGKDIGVSASCLSPKSEYYKRRMFDCRTKNLGGLFLLKISKFVK